MNNLTTEMQTQVGKGPVASPLAHIHVVSHFPCVTAIQLCLSYEGLDERLGGRGQYYEKPSAQFNA